MSKVLLTGNNVYLILSKNFIMRAFFINYLTRKKDAIPILAILLFLFGSSAFGQTDQYKKIEKSLLRKGDYYRSEGNLDSSLYYANKLIEHQKNHGSTSGLIRAYEYKIITLKFFHKSTEGFELTLACHEKYCRRTQTLEECEMCDGINQIMSDYFKTMRDFRESLRFLNKICSKPHEYYFKKAMLYLWLDLSDSAIITTSNYLSSTLKEGDPEQIVQAYNNNGLVYRRLNRYPEAIEMFSKALETIEKSELKEDRYGYIHGNLGFCYMSINDTDNAKESLLTDSKLSLSANEMESYILAEMALLQIEIQEEAYHEGIERLDRLTQKYQHHLNIEQKKETLSQYSVLYKKIGDKEKREVFLEEWQKATEQHSQSVIESNRKMVQDYAQNALKNIVLQSKAEKNLLEQKLVSQEREEERDRFRKWLFISLLLLIILVIVFLLWKRRNEIAHKETQLMLVTKEQEFLKLKIEQEKRNINELSHELLMKEGFSKNLIEKLSRLDKISQPELKNFEMFIQNELDMRSTRAQMQVQLNKGGNLYNALRIMHPSLSDNDISLAAMVVSNMTNKEIGISKNMSVGTVKTTKNRLKKKLGLTPDDNMTNYLKSLIG